MNLKMKKITSIFLIMMMFIMLISTSSIAYEVGDILHLNSYVDFLDNPNLFCTQEDQLILQAVDYKAISKIEIDGDTSIDHEGNVIKSPENLKLAYIISAENTDDVNIPNDKFSDKENGQVQQALWNYIGTWLEKVGYKHAGLTKSFGYNSRGDDMQLLREADEYMRNYKDKGSSDIVDNTKKEDITITKYKNGGSDYLRVGPFQWTFGGKISGIDMKDASNKNITGLKFSKFVGKDEKFIKVGEIKSGDNIYISIPATTNMNDAEKLKIKVKEKVKNKKVALTFFETQTTAQNLIHRERFPDEREIDNTFEYDVKGNLKIIKVNKDDHKVKLPNVGFYIKNNDINKYIKKTGNNITYVSNKSQATEFVTNTNGEINIKGILLGSYTAYETKNPNYGYQASNEVTGTAVIKANKLTTMTIENKQIKVKLSGYVWEDIIFGKQSLRNDLFKDNNYDINDKLLDGIVVRLKDRTGKVIQEARTSNGGKYLFRDVLIEEINKDNYYIEFEYDGLTYTNVVPHIDKDNGSKSAENAKVRQDFNNNFAIVEGKTENSGITKDTNGNEKHTLKYELNKGEHKSKLVNEGQYKISAITDETGYKIKNNFKWGMEEIKNINLGLYRREQPDIALIKDIENVKVSVNGFNHIYNYSQRFVNQGEYGDGFNVGVKFGNKYGNMSYSRPVYKADYEYENNDKSKELQVYITYKIKVRNESTNLKVRVNSLADYYDSNYEVIKAGTTIKDGEIQGNIGHQESSYNNNYKKMIINSNSTIDPQKETDIFVQFKLNRESVINILNDKSTLDNVVEINSYSVFDEQGKVYAGIDKDSNPGNVNPEDRSTFQDDTDSSPALKLVLADARELSGKVFLDSTTGELQVGKVRQGDGKYTEGEKGIPGVNITLKENSGSGKVYEATTNKDGDFLITGFIPGKYTVTYTWGDETYTVQNYKATIYNDKNRMNNPEWYKDIAVRNSDALDNYETRKAIDGEMKEITNKTNYTIHKMDSTTPNMDIGVEYDNLPTVPSTGENKLVYEIKFVDLGIVERARQNLELDKRVGTFKITLANGQVIADVTIDENGKLSGNKEYVTYMKPSANAIPKNGWIKAELDNEIIQGANLEVGYVITAKNNSELDYLSKDFYDFGEIKGNLVTIKPTAIVDYLDKDWAFNENDNKEWQVKTLDEIKNLLDKNVYEIETSTIKDKTILYTEALKEKAIEPTKSESVMLKVSKILASTDDISLDNETEIVKINKTGGSATISIPGNYVPGTGRTETDDDMAETVIVTPATGENRNYLVIGIIGISTMLILGAGVYIIKKKVL